jgi:hypothetical protein
VEEGIPVEGAVLPIEVRFGTTSGSETVTSGLICIVVGGGKGSETDVDWLPIDVLTVGWLVIGEGIDKSGGESNGVVLGDCGCGLVSD